MKAGSLGLLLVVVGVHASLAARAHAQEAEAAQEPQEPVTLAVFPTAAQDPALRELASALDPVVLSALDALAQAKVTARPPLDLPATQLAIDCIGETSACLRTLTEQSASEALLAPSLERAGDEMVVTLLYFGARGEGTLRSVARRYSGDNVEGAALDAVPGMLRELFGIAEPAPEPPAPAEAKAAPPRVPGSDLAPEEPVLRKTAFPPVPVAITATGVAVLGAGVVFGLMSNASEDDYASIEIGTKADVDAARDELDTARSQALIANIGMGVGAAVIALGAALWIAELSGDRDEPSARVSPWLAPDEVGLALSGTFGGDEP